MNHRPRKKVSALYDYFSLNKINQFDFVSGNRWQYVYGYDSIPKVLVFVEGVSETELINQPTTKEKEGYYFLERFGRKIGLATVYIRYAIDIEEVKTIQFSKDSIEFQTLTWYDLAQLLRYYKVSVGWDQVKRRKFINSDSELALWDFHQCFVTRSFKVNIDFWSLSEEGFPECAFIIKCGSISFENWTPYYPNDIHMYQLLSKFCRFAGIKAKLTYNLTSYKPYVEHIDNIRVYSIDYSKEKDPITSDGIFTLEEFLKIYNNDPEINI